MFLVKTGLLTPSGTAGAVFHKNFSMARWYFSLEGGAFHVCQGKEDTMERAQMWRWTACGQKGSIPVVFYSHCLVWVVNLGFGHFVSLCFVCSCVCGCLCVHLCTCVHTCLCLCVHLCVCMSLFLCLCGCVCLCDRVAVSLCVFVCLSVCGMRLHVSLYVCLCSCLCVTVCVTGCACVSVHLCLCIPPCVTVVDTFTCLCFIAVLVLFMGLYLIS